jgi:type II secretory ATPase GspE/PulE/Tfp pilus assembly ATPase PilB-like protein
MMGILASLPVSGDYFSVVKIVFMLVLTTPWLLACPWVNKDVKHVRATAVVWNGAVMGAGALGLLIWFLMPMYFLGLAVFVVLAASSMGAYVLFRNGRVPPEARVLTADHLKNVFSHRATVKLAVENRVKLYGNDGKAVVAPTADDSDLATIEDYNLAQTILYDMLFMRASEADMTPSGQQGRVRFVIDGVVSERPPLEIAQSERIVDYLKPLAGMDVEDRRRPQQGKISVDLAGKPIDMMLTAAGTTGGQRLQFKIVQEFVQTSIEMLGISDELLASIRRITKTPGMLIIAGGHGSGVTSSLYSVLRDQDAYVKQLVTLEQKPVVDMENMTQTAYGEPSKLAEMLASAVRRDPDFLMIDECKDQQAAQMIAQVAESKTLVMGLAAGDSFTALGRWVKMVGSTREAIGHLNGIMCQMLLRKLCPTCREAYRPDPKFLAKANMPAQNVEVFYRPPSGPLMDEKGRPYLCPTCHGNGYFGRTGVFELLEITDALREMLLAKAPALQIQAACRKNKMLYLQEQALRKVIEGTTSIQEVIRVTQQSKKA